MCIKSSPKGGDFVKGQIYKQKYGYVVRRGVISKYFKEIEDAENYLDELNIKPTRLSQKHDNII